MTSQSYTLDYQIIEYDHSLSKDEYQEMANNSGMHAIYVAINSYEDFLLFSEWHDGDGARRL